MIRKDFHPHGEQLSAYIDSMLDVSRMRGIGEHLCTCASCRSLEADLRRTKQLVRGLPDPAPAAEFWISAYRRLRVDDRERQAAQRSWSVWRSPEQRAHRRWAAGLAAAAVAAVALSAGPLTPAPQTLPSAQPPAPLVRPLVPAQDVSPDVSSLAALHTDSVSRLPLADSDRQKMIAADALEAAGYADASF